MKPDDVIPIVIQAEAADQLMQEANALGHELAQSERKNLATAKKIGGLLVKAKEHVAHGDWVEFVEKKCLAFSVRDAQRYMRIHRHWAKVQYARGIRDAIEQLADVPDEPDAKNDTVSFLVCDRCKRLGIARQDCEQCAEAREGQRDTGEGRASTRPGSGGSGRAGGSAGTTHRPSPPPPNEERQAELDWENRRTNDLRVRQALQRCRNAIEGLAEDFDVLLELRAADMLELTRLHGIPTDTREHESMPIVDGQTRHTLECETYSPALEGFDRVFRDLAAREVGP